MQPLQRKSENMYDYYAALGVEKEANDGEIKKAYRALAKTYHPDLNPGNQAAEKTFKEIIEAYSILSDPEKRKQYDQQQAGPQQDNRMKKTENSRSPQAAPPNFARMQGEFERFFGFQPKNGEITDEEKLKPKNPLDVSGMFEKFMGFK